MVQPPLYDVYLCDNCDEEFNTLKEVKDHEKSCCEKQQEAIRDPSPLSVSGENSKESFLGYFKLVDAKDKHFGKSEDRPLRKRGFRNSLRYSSIPISSPLGSLVYKKTKATSTASAVHLERLERYCPAKPSSANAENRGRGNTPWPVSWKPRKKGEEDSDWVHVYRKPGRQWRKRKTVAPKKLCDKNQRLLSQCQNLQVHVRKLTPHEIALYTNTSSATRRASVGSVVDHSKLVMPLLPRHSTNSVHISSVKVNNSIIDFKDSQKQAVQVNMVDSVHSTKNGKSTSKLESICNDTTVRRKNQNSLEKNVPQKITRREVPLSSLYPRITCEAYSPEELVSNSMSCELTCIPVIDLVSSDEECELI